MTESMALPSLAEVAASANRIADNIEKVILGKRHDVIDYILAALLSGGHVLLEDVPGVGKTSLAKSLATSLGCTIRRVQFTPDLLPSDITGVSVYHGTNQDFHFMEGPVFANVVLADEINRASPKTQAALLECMEEGQVTIDGCTRKLPRPFFVMATQNPIEYEGTYPLPESQLDRFVMRQCLGYPPREHERQVVARQSKPGPLETLTAVTDAAGVLAMQESIKRVHVSDAATDYLLSVVEATRVHPSLYLGASPRGSIALYRAAQALAVLRGYEYVLPDHIKKLAPRVLAHRVIVRPEARIGGLNTEEIIEDILKTVPVDV